MMPLYRLLSLTLCCATALPALAATANPSQRAPRNDALAQCSWDRPGRNAFSGDVVAAIDRYSDIPTPVRVRLKERMQAREYDDMVDIRRDSINGKFEYAGAIRDMHFGKDRVCRQVTRSKWTDKTHERGLVYCESEHCILVPTRVPERQPHRSQAGAGGGQRAQATGGCAAGAGARQRGPRQRCRRCCPPAGRPRGVIVF